MPAELLSSGAFVFSWAATYFLHSTCLLAGAWLVLRLYRSAGHTLREALWKTALVGGVVTASVQMLLAPGVQFGEINLALDGIFSPDSSAKSAPHKAGSIPAAAGNSRSSTIEGAKRSVSVDDSGPAESDGEIWTARELSAEFADFSDETDAAREHLIEGAALPRPAAGWWNSAAERIREHAAAGAMAIAIGTAFVVILLAIASCACQTLTLRRKLVHCSIIDAGVARRLLDALCRLVPKTPHVLLLSAPDDSEPAAFGIRRWTIVLPRRAIQDLSEDELRALLAHELAHLVRGDSKWLCISRVVCSCLAFQPLNHLARREWQRAAEFLCDNWAVSRTGTPLALARCLAEVAGWRNSGRASAALLAATGRKSGLVDRIERLLDARPVSEAWNDVRAKRRMFVGGALLLVFLTWCAPRVEIALAGSDRASFVQSQRVTIDDNRPFVTADAGGVAIAEDATKRPADQENALRDVAPPSHRAGAPTNAALEDSSSSALELLDSLARELHDLERELGEIQPLLLEGNPPPRLVRLAKRLQFQITKLKRNREALHGNWKKSVGQMARE